MAPVELLPELWSKIIELLVCPRPRPNGANPRSAIHQPSLVACMRVNKLLNILTAPLLYEVIITDHLPSLIYGLFLPRAAPGIPSKEELLSYNVRLFLEHGSKDHASYDWIMRDGQSRWNRVGMDEKGLLALCDEECDSIVSATRAFSGLPTQRYSVSTGSFLDGQEALWKRVSSRMEAGSGEERQRLWAARDAICGLVGSPYPMYYCHRVQTGPLVFPSILCDKDTWSPVLGIPTHRAHSGIDIQPPPLAAQTQSRWYVRFPPLQSDSDVETAIQQLSSSVCTYLVNRENIISNANDSQVQARRAAVSSVDISLYLPSSMSSLRWKPVVLDALKQAVWSTFNRLQVPFARANKDVWSL